MLICVREETNWEWIQMINKKKWWYKCKNSKCAKKNEKISVLVCIFIENDSNDDGKRKI